jgi:2TM domain
MTDTRSDPFDRAVHRTAVSAARRQWAGWRIHFAVYVAVQVLLFATWGIVWASGGTAFPWPVFPLLGWGIGVVAHYAAVRYGPDRELAD